jgi:hypothetical protein
VLLEFKIPRQKILDWFRCALAQHDRLLERGIGLRQKSEAELQSAILELQQKIDRGRKRAESAEKEGQPHIPRMDAGRRALLAVQKAAEEAPSRKIIAQRIHRSQPDEVATIERLKRKVENLREFMPQSVLRTSEIHIPPVDELCECDASRSSH